MATGTESFCRITVSENQVVKLTLTTYVQNKAALFLEGLKKAILLCNGKKDIIIIADLTSVVISEEDISMKDIAILKTIISEVALRHQNIHIIRVIRDMNEKDQLAVDILKKILELNHSNIKSSIQVKNINKAMEIAHALEN